MGLQWTHRIAGRVYMGHYVANLSAAASGNANDEVPAVESGAEADVGEGISASAASELLPFDKELEEKSKRSLSSPLKPPWKQAVYR